MRGSADRTQVECGSEAPALLTCSYLNAQACFRKGEIEKSVSTRRERGQSHVEYHTFAGKSMGLKHFFKPRVSFLSGVSWHSTRVFFGFNMTCIISFKFDYMSEV
jgi:hypothetical protein